jgi:signal transduction histidine kinase
MRRALALLVAATTSLVLIAFLVPLGLLIRWGTEERAVSGASSQASALSPVVATAERGSDTVALALAGVTAETGHPFTVFYPDGSTVGSAVERSSAVDLAAARGQSLTAQAAGGREVLVAVGLPDGAAVIRTLVPDDELTEGVLRTWLLLAVLGVALVALGVLLADRMARRLVRPLVDASLVSRRLAGGELEARVEPGGTAEVQEVGTGLNRLAARITTMLADEREAVADLSHRLRTPLTALRLEAEAIDDPDVSRRVGAGVDALERAVTQAIHDARRRGASQAEDIGCDAAAVVGERVAFWSVLAEDTDRSMTATLASGPLLVRATADDLAAALDALLGNVFAHTPDGTSLSVQLTAATDGGATLVVADAGPGFGHAGVVERGTSAAASTGLGLDIARRVAESSGGSLRTGTSALGGAEVTLMLGASATP